MQTKQSSPYERQAALAIHVWKHPTPTRWGKGMAAIYKPFNSAGDALLSTALVKSAMEKSMVGLLSLLNDVAALSLRPKAVFRDFDPPVGSLADIHVLDLEDADKAVGYLATKYKGVALGEGALAGSLSLANPVVAAAAIAADTSTLLALNLRAVSEYATYYGFDISRQEERLFALNVLGLASAPGDAAKIVAMGQLVKIAQQVAAKRTWRQLNKQAFVQVVQTIAKSLSIRLTKAKLAQVIPALGIVVGGGFNAYYTNKVCDAAYFLYRERFLARKYGAEFIEATVEPAAADDFGDGYVDVDFV